MRNYNKIIPPILGFLVLGVLGILLANYLDDGYRHTSRIAHKITLGVGGLSILMVCFSIVMSLIVMKNGLLELKNSRFPSKVKPVYTVLSWEENREIMKGIYTMCEQGLDYKVVESNINQDSYTLSIRSWNLMVEVINEKNSENSNK